MCRKKDVERNQKLHGWRAQLNYPMTDSREESKLALKPEDNEDITKSVRSVEWLRKGVGGGDVGKSTVAGRMWLRFITPG